jgi:uncharacterized protein YigE (DUF2233 family)
MHRRFVMISTAVGLFASLYASAQAVPWAVTSREPVVPMAAGAAYHAFSVGGEDSVDFQVVVFDSARCGLRIVDQPREGDAVSLGEALRPTAAIAGVNGGFFTPAFTPLGLVISNGKRVGAVQRSGLLGGVLMVRKGRLQLLWRDEFTLDTGVTELIQAGPRLVANGTAIVGLKASDDRPRTFVATNGEGRWALGICRYASLAALAQILATPGIIPGVEIDRALNFDGGKSTGLWLRTMAGEEVYESEIATVRNFVTIEPRK